MRESHPELIGYPGKIVRQWLPWRLAIKPVVHDAANPLFGQQPYIAFKQLPTREDLGRQFQYSYLQVVLFQFSESLLR